MKWRLFCENKCEVWCDNECEVGGCVCCEFRGYNCVIIFRNCLVVSKISCNFASPLGEMCRHDNVNCLIVNDVEATNVYKG